MNNPTAIHLKRKKEEDNANEDRFTNIEFLETYNVLRILKISESTLYRYRKTGKIPFKKIGGKYVYPKSYFIGLTKEAIATLL
jgi:predicted DNA-binding transcriptional regulator AlpA